MIIKNNYRKPSVYLLAIAVSALSLCISIASIIFGQLYTERLNTITQFELLGQDIVTAIVSAIFIYIVIFKDFSRIKIKVIWLGLLMYLFYIYAYFSFGGISSIFYLLYLVIAGISLYLFFFILGDIVKIKQLPLAKKKYPRVFISAFLILCVFIVTSIEVVELVKKTIINQEAINPFYVFYVLDLVIVFPFIVIASVLNYRKSSFGYLLSGIALIKVITILPAVIFNDIFHKIYVCYFLDLTFDIIAIIISLLGIYLFIRYLKGIK
jgi:hypothetical protein